METKGGLKIDLGGGEYPYGHGFLNVDARPLPTVDIQCDLRDLVFPNDSVEEIFSCAVLEHFKLEDSILILKEAFRVLKPNGKLTLIVPDLKIIMEDYLNKRIGFEKLNLYLYGSQKYGYDIHRISYDFENFKRILEEIGFIEVQQQPYSLDRSYENCPMLQIVAFKKREQNFQKGVKTKEKDEVVKKNKMNYYQEIEGKTERILERAVPHSTDNIIYLLHLTRYKFAASFLKEKSVLDIGCGSGYGSFLLSQEATDVVGIDYSKKAIDFATEHFYRDNLMFKTMDWRNLANLNKVFDGVVALEFLEHIDRQEEFLKIVSNLLAKEGTFILSTPNKNLSLGNNIYHLREVNPYELEKLLGDYFEKITIYAQFLRPEYLHRKEEFQKLQLYLEQFPRNIIRKFIPHFIRRCLPDRWKIAFWKKVWREKIQSEEELISAFCSPDAPFKNLINITAEDILISSSKKDIWSADYLLAVCQQ